MNYDNLLDEMNYEKEDILNDLPLKTEYKRIEIETDSYTIDNLLAIKTQNYIGYEI